MGKSRQVLQNRAATRKFGFTPFLLIFAKFCQVLPSFTDFWTFSKAPPFASKNTEFWEKSVYRLIFGIPTTVAALLQKTHLFNTYLKNHMKNRMIKSLADCSNPLDLTCIGLEWNILGLFAAFLVTSIFVFKKNGPL